MKYEIRPAKGSFDGLKDVDRSRLFVGDVALLRVSVAAGFGSGVHGAMLAGVGSVIDQEVEQVVHADVAEAGGEEHGEDLVVLDGLVQRRHQMFFGDSSLVEELFHQLVFALGDDLDQLLVGFFALLGDVVWDIGPSFPLPLPPIS